MTFHRNNIFRCLNSYLLVFLLLFFSSLASGNPKSGSFSINSYVKYTGLYHRFPILFYNYLNSIGRDYQNLKRQIKPKISFYFHFFFFLFYCFFLISKILLTRTLKPLKDRCNQTYTKFFFIPSLLTFFFCSFSIH